MEKLETILKTLDDKLAEDVKVIDLDSSSIADKFVIASGGSINQTRALADYIEDDLEKEGYSILSKEGLREGEWILLDAGDIIVHIFTQKQREFYDLENLWEN
ncbi:MAG: ribosome silencing factor [Anaerococcus sp.]|uniref:ribosome silencing factor n=1 Tax=Anaerococcus sp. TaxID=1872515 RepID=UPI0025C2C956|nr:ribosome silencing factor [Anaerococcus sp.]MCI5971413.1 ribosome silencing factor [Anaerococcus sp.]MDD6919211.1 ribosome silencing factor [Peptoniphilaceae bacterium]MDY2928115.1 ribosome silencing factor [Anaerococcus sp.]